MKRTSSLRLLLFVGAALGWWGRGAPAGAAGGGRGAGVEKCAARNGDVNADSTVDLADAVTVLGHLFLGNPVELEPLCATAPAATGLPDTGQNVCYGFDEAQGWVEVPCDQAACQGQDTRYATGCTSEGRFTDNGDGTVMDHCTGLMWQKDTADVNGDGQSTDQDVLQWCEALSYCEGLSFAGHDDWRLPNVRELQSIVDYGRSDPSIDPVFGALPWDYWSSTSNPGAPGGAFLVRFNSGFVFGAAKGGDGTRDFAHVRAVRSGP